MQSTSLPSIGLNEDSEENAWGGKCQENNFSLFEC